MSAAMNAMIQVLSDLREGRDHTAGLMPFADLRRTVGFEQYYAAEARYLKP